MSVQLQVSCPSNTLCSIISEIQALTGFYTALIVSSSPSPSLALLSAFELGKMGMKMGCTLTEMLSLAMTSHSLQHYSLLPTQAATCMHE